MEGGWTGLIEIRNVVDYLGNIKSSHQIRGLLFLVRF